MSFHDKLELSLTLAIGSESFTLDGGSVKSVRITARPYGFVGELTFHISLETDEDPVFAGFIAKAPIKISLSMTAAELPPGSEAIEPLLFHGLVTERSLSEIVSEDVSGEPIVLRRYSVRFSDVASVLWRTHRPAALYADTTMRAVIEAQTPAALTVALDWGVLDAQREQICIALPDEESSFYDFLLTFIDANGGVFEHDATEGSYRIGAAKKSGGTVVPLIDEDLAEYTVQLPEISRRDTRLQNSFSEQPSVTDLPWAQRVSGVRKDILLRSPITTVVDRRGALEKQKMSPPDDGLKLRFSRFPRATFRIHDLVELGDGFSARAWSAEKKYRVTSIDLFARAAKSSESDEADLEEPTAEMEIEMTAELELAANKKAHLPEFVPVSGPIYVEGKIVSMGGGENDRTWMPIEDEKTSINNYQVEVPLWNVKILVPFMPEFFAGHFFFPAYKKQRVLLALERDNARITRFLDWAANARVPQDSQGNRIALGKQAADGTIIEHVYQDAKPKLFVKRTFGQDLQTLEISEGVVRFEVKEDPAAQAREPTFDVTMQVEAAVGTLNMQVGGSIAEVSGKYEASSTGVTTSIEGAKGELEGSLSSMETAMVGRIDTTKAAIEGAAADLEQSLGAVAASVVAAKAELSTAAAGAFTDLQASIARADGAVTAFGGEASGQIAQTQGTVASLGNNILTPLDTLIARAVSTGGSLESDVRALESDVGRLASGTSGPWPKFSALINEVADVDRAVASAFTPVRSNLEAAATKAEQDWGSVESAINARKQKLDRAKNDLLAKKRALDPRAARQPANLARLTAVGTAIENAFANAKQPLDTLSLNTAAQKKTARAPVDRALESIKSVEQGLKTQTGTLRTQIQDQEKTLRETMTAAANPLLANLRTFTSTVVDPTKAISTELATTKQTIKDAIATAKAPLSAGLTTIEQQIKSTETTLRAPITAAKNAIQAADRQVQSTVKAANDALDALLQSGVSSVQSLLAQVRTIVDAASAGLEAIRDLVLALKQTIMPPIIEISARLADLERMFSTAVSALRSLLTGAVATLRAIPAEALPKPLVQPALSAIESAISAVAPQISTAAQQAGTQLANVAGQIQQQVGTVKTQLVTAITSFTTSTTTQIDAVLPQVKAQLDALKAQMTAAIAQLTGQINNAKNAAVQAINSTKTTIKTQVDGVVSQAEGALTTARNTVSQAIGGVRTQITNAESQLAAQAQGVTRTAEAQLDAAKSQGTALGTTVRTAIKNAETSATKAADTFATPTRGAIAAAKTSVDRAAAAADQQVAAVGTELAAPINAAKAATPADTALDASIASLRAPIDAELTAIERDMSR